MSALGQAMSFFDVGGLRVPVYLLSWGMRLVKNMYGLLSCALSLDIKLMLSWLERNYNIVVIKSSKFFLRFKLTCLKSHDVELLNLSTKDNLQTTTHNINLGIRNLLVSTVCKVVVLAKDPPSAPRPVEDL